MPLSTDTARPLRLNTRKTIASLRRARRDADALRSELVRCMEDLTRNIEEARRRDPSNAEDQ